MSQRVLSAGCAAGATGDVLVVSHGSGYVAREIVSELAAAPGGHRLIALGPAVEPIADFSCDVMRDPCAATCCKALEGVGELVLLPTLDAAETAAQVRMVEAARDSGVKRVHLVSRVGAELSLPVCLVRWAGRVEKAIRDAGVPHTILRCAPFMQNIRFFVDDRDGTMRLVGPFREAAFPWIDARDVGAILARIIEQGGDSIACQLAGPDECNFDQIAAMLSRAVGREVRYVDVSLPEAQGILEARGFTPQRIRTVTEFWDYVVSGVVASRPCPMAEAQLGRPPRRLADYIRELGAELAGSPVPA